ncbi:Hydantoinase B/oxoprolinase-domain-containing protein [Blastocladiella britannica]|nr:Hydantoinase B/oxoprolinase-domain-containing protein [Blastocladiella britannica]
MAHHRNIRVAIDRGGTFTDVFASMDATDGRGEPATKVFKLLSVDTKNYADANVEGIRRVLEHFTGEPHPRGVPLNTSRLASIRLGTTVATNALLERNGEPCALVINRGFKDLLHIANQSRPNIFDLKVLCPEVLYDAVVEVDERITPASYSIRTAASPAPDDVTVTTKDGDTIVLGVTGEPLRVLRPLDLPAVERSLTDLYATGIRSVAICLLHSYMYPTHERAIADAARRIGFTNVTASAEIMPRVKVVARGMTAVTDAYLTPKIQQYVASFLRGFASLDGVEVEFMRSDGGLTPVNDFRGYAAILSGPAGGVVGYALTSYSKNKGIPALGFDMGGTSTDVSRYAGSFDHVFETTTAGVTITSPQLDINTVAAGGSSRLFFRNGMFVVGPESAGSEPGPVCYRKPGGVLAITDANLVLGRISVAHFPHIFGPSEREAVNVEGSTRAFAAITQEINATQGTNMSVDEVAYGFIRVANHAMGQKVLAVTQAKGYDVTKHTLACFGGAAAQHAVELARNLGIHRVFVHRHAAILSAYGLSLASMVHEVTGPCAIPFTAAAAPVLRAKLAAMTAEAHAYFQSRGYSASNGGADVEVEEYCNLRYEGTDTNLMVRVPPVATATAAGEEHEEVVAQVVRAFEADYVREFGFKLDRALVVDDLRVRASARSRQHGAAGILTGDDLEAELATLVRTPAPVSSSTLTQSSYFERTGRIDVPVYVMHADNSARLLPGHVVRGPALVLDTNTTLVLPPGSEAVVTRSTLVVNVDVGDDKGAAATQTAAAVEDISCDPIQLSLFGHRFMHIAEQMGYTLQKTAVSTNIKERLDFSCALFSPSGHLVSNAPHLPVHMGAMQEAVKHQIKLHPELHEGDVLVTNHPQFGGSHLPDITVITPVFLDGNVILFVASRGHHADIGGISPGSMPPHSKFLWQEGAAIRGFKIVERGVFQEKGITDLLNAPAQHPGCTGTRNLRDNLSDLRAQIAANQRGIALCLGMINECGLATVHAYMEYIRQAADAAVRDLLRATVTRLGTTRLHAIDAMDDGSPIELTVDIDVAKGSAKFDFSGTGPEVFGNFNAPQSVSHSATIYCLRSMLASDIPLNHGCLNPIDICIPPGSLLAPSEDAAVVGGNVLTSQRLVDVILKAFQFCAASQGDMNNFTFGVSPSSPEADDGWGYYETIAGGAGAGPSWHGRSGVHTHMTNTRITDPEILERRYPVILHQFSLRSDSGGAGQYRGGDGVVRDMEFLVPMEVSIMSERRTLRPYGMAGGSPGAPGLNLLLKRSSAASGGEYRTMNLGGKNAVWVSVGDRVVIHTPGGGGYGRATAGAVIDDREVEVAVPYRESGSSLQRFLDQYSA